MPGDRRTGGVERAVQAVAEAGTTGTIGVFPAAPGSFPAKAVNRNLPLNMGTCNQRNYVPRLLALVRAGAVDPVGILTEAGPKTSAISAHEGFDRREPGSLEVEPKPPGCRRGAAPLIGAYRDANRRCGRHRCAGRAQTGICQGPDATAIKRRRHG